MAPTIRRDSRSVPTAGRGPAVLRGLVEHAPLRVIGISGVERFTLDAASRISAFSVSRGDYLGERGPLWWD